MKKKRLLTDRTGMLEERMAEEAARQMQTEMDAEILRGMLKEMGWHEVVLKPMTHELGVIVDDWVKKQVKGRCHFAHGLVWMFEEERDATWFKLRWLSASTQDNH